MLYRGSVDTAACKIRKIVRESGLKWTKVKYRDIILFDNCHNSLPVCSLTYIKLQCLIYSVFV